MPVVRSATRTRRSKVRSGRSGGKMAKHQVYHISEKACSKCGILKQINQFGIRRHSVDGVRSECSACRTSQRRDRGDKARRTFDKYSPTRKCNACDNIFPNSAFGINKAIPDGLNLVCKNSSSRRKKQRTIFTGGRTQNKHDSLERVCSECGKLKPLDEYPIAKQCRDGKASACKVCAHMKARKKRLENPSEHSEAVGFFNWFESNFPKVLIFHIPNGMKRHLGEAIKLKAEGVKRGIPDYQVPEWKLWIEIKKVKGGTLSPDQRRIGEYLESIGHTVIIGYGARDASRQVLELRRNKII